MFPRRKSFGAWIHGNPEGLEHRFHRLTQIQEYSLLPLRPPAICGGQI
jgi:hypothetical protein